jgi:hypothetical protein
MYRIEYQWDSTQQTVRPGSIRPFVIVGTESYKMDPVMKMSNRWEAWVPVPPNQTDLVYQIKANYQYAVFGGFMNASKISKEYTLTIK